MPRSRGRTLKVSSVNGLTSVDGRSVTVHEDGTTTLLEFLALFAGFIGNFESVHSSVVE
jgi:hypothetical protein